MVCPTASIPTYGRGVWLECNGQSFKQAQFPQLYETLGTNRVPDYQGMFLRGYGSQSYSQTNGEISGISSTTHSSGSIGSIQGDSSRQIYGYLGFLLSYDTFAGGYNSFKYYASANKELGMVYLHDGSTPFPAYIPINQNEWYAGGHHNVFSSTATENNAGEAFKRYRYQISGDSESGYTLTETEEYPMLDAMTRVGTYAMNSKRVLPTSNEIRPVNVAVKFMIKAK